MKGLSHMIKKCASGNAPNIWHVQILLYFFLQTTGLWVNGEVCKCTNKSILLLRKAIKEVEMARIYCTHQFFKKLVFASPVSNIQCCKIKFGQVKILKEKLRFQQNLSKPHSVK